MPSDSMITLYGISNCDSVKKTRKWLEQHQLNYDFYDYKKQDVSIELAETFLSHFPLRELINTRGTTWRKLPEQQKNNLTEASAVKLMCLQPSVIKRPIIRQGERWVLGFSESNLQSFRNQ